MWIRRLKADYSWLRDAILEAKVFVPLQCTWKRFARLLKDRRQVMFVYECLHLLDFRLQSVGII